MKILFMTKGKTTGGLQAWKEYLVKALNRPGIELLEGHNVFTLLLIPRVDIVHIYNASVLDLSTILFSKLFRKKIIFTIHGNYYDELSDKTGIKRFFWLPFHKFCSGFADYITFPSEYLYKIIVSKEPKIAGRSEIIHNGIDINVISNVKAYEKEHLNVPNGETLFVTVTNFNLAKKSEGVSLLISKFQEFSLQYTKHHLIIVGGGKLLDKYKSKYETSNITFLGYRNDATSIVKASDLFLYFSFLDNTPYTILEAMACNKPILALPTGGIPEMLPSQCLTDGRLGLNSTADYRDHLDSYSAAVVANEFLKLYKTVLSSK